MSPCMINHLDVEVYSNCATVLSNNGAICVGQWLN